MSTNRLAPHTHKPATADRAVSAEMAFERRYQQCECGAERTVHYRLGRVDFLGSWT